MIGAVSAKLAVGAGVAGLVLLLGVGAWGTTMLIQRNLARAEVITATAALETERANVKDWQRQFKALQTVSDEQSRGINALFDAQQAEERRHRDEVAAARIEAQPMKDRSREIAAFKPSPGKDPDEETRVYIDNLLRKEREQ